MDFDAALLFAMTVSAFGWFISIRLVEKRKHIKARQEREVVVYKWLGSKSKFMLKGIHNGF